jgi:hypothetical protein
MPCAPTHARQSIARQSVARQSKRVKASRVKASRERWRRFIAIDRGRLARSDGDAGPLMHRSPSSAHLERIFLKIAISYLSFKKRASGR